MYSCSINVHLITIVVHQPDNVKENQGCSYQGKQIQFPRYTKKHHYDLMFSRYLYKAEEGKK